MQGSQQLPQISTTPSLSNPNNSVRMLLLLLALTLFVQLELMLAFFEQIGFLFVFSFSFPCMICIWKHPWSKPCSSQNTQSILYCCSGFKFCDDCSLWWVWSVPYQFMLNLLFFLQCIWSASLTFHLDSGLWVMILSFLMWKCCLFKNQVGRGE